MHPAISFQKMFFFKDSSQINVCLLSHFCFRFLWTGIWINPSFCSFAKKIYEKLHLFSWGMNSAGWLYSLFFYAANLEAGQRRHPASPSAPGGFGGWLWYWWLWVQGQAPPLSTFLSLAFVPPTHSVTLYLLCFSSFVWRHSKPAPFRCTVWNWFFCVLSFQKDKWSSIIVVIIDDYFLPFTCCASGRCWYFFPGGSILPK